MLNLGMSIYIPVIFVSALYYAIGHFINKENAKILLAGYNFMTDKERKTIMKTPNPAKPLNAQKLLNALKTNRMPIKPVKTTTRN